MNATNLTRHYEHLEVWERVRLRMAAYVRKDEAECERLSNAAPLCQKTLRHHFWDELILHMFALMHVGEQLESIAFLLCAQVQVRDVPEAPYIRDFADAGGIHAYCFHMRRLGWRKFCKSIGVDPDALVKGNYPGMMLELCEKKMLKFALTPEQMIEWFGSHGLTPKTLISEESEYQSWRRMLEGATSGAPCFN